MEATFVSSNPPTQCGPSQLAPKEMPFVEEAKRFRAEFLARQYALDVMRAPLGSLSELGRAIERLWIQARSMKHDEELSLSVRRQ